MFGISKKQGFKNLNITVHPELVAGVFTSGTMTLEEKIKCWANNTILPDPDNRGNGKLDNSKVNDIAKNFNVKGLSIFPIEDQEDGTFLMIDGHHRRGGTEKRHYELGGVSIEDLKKHVQVMIAPKGMGDELYALLGNTRGVSTKQNIQHARKGLGSLLQDILSRQTTKSYVLEKFYPSIAKCIYAHIGRMQFTEENSDDIKEEKYISFAETSKDRRVVNSDAKLTKDNFDIELSNSQKKEIADAIDYVNSVYCEFEKNQNLSAKPGKIKLSEIAESILASAGLYGFLLWDKLSSRNIVTDLKPKSLAMRMSEKDSSVEEASSNLMNSRNRDEAAKKLTKLLNNKNIARYENLTSSSTN